MADIVGLRGISLLQRIKPSAVRYIKLGPGNAWFRSCRENRRIEFGHADVPHSLAKAGDWEGVVDHLIANGGRTPGKARDFVREIRDFYTLGMDCLWITFADGRLWWALAEPSVEWLGDDGRDHGVRCRKVVGEWRDRNIGGALLEQSRLSTRLTQVAAYRQTLCRVEAEDYAIRRINGDTEPVVAKARKMQTRVTEVAAEMIAGLHWRDFEVLVDLIFTRNGWRRSSAVGGTQKDIDLAIEQPVTGERAFVQVKSRADAAVLRDYAERFSGSSTYDRIFFVCHSAKGTLSAPVAENIDVWSGGRLADMALKSGLFDWLVERSG